MSEQMRHTPGPWNAFGHFVNVEKDGHFHNIAEFYYPGQSLAHVAANAQLAAAAPLMLEVLRLARDCERRDGEGFVAEAVAEHRLGEKIRAAIAKAEGESNGA